MSALLYIAQLEKQYIPYLKNIILGRPFQPIVLRGGKNKPETTAQLHQLVKLFQTHEKNEHDKGWSIEWDNWTSRTFGKQQWPAAIRVTTEEDFLHLIKKEKEALAFKEQLQQLLQWNPAIQTWLANKPKLVLELHRSWTGICSVADHLLQHNVSDLYLRSLTVPVHTKFIEQHKRTIYSILHHLNNEKFPSADTELEEALALKRKPFLFTIRWLDEELANRFTSGMHLFAVPVDYLQQQQWHIERVILVENETNLYLFNPIAGTLVICSNGKALHLLKEINFLHHTHLYYWGDMDEEGFNMLNDVRKYYNHITSLFMDDVTVEQHQAELDIKPSYYKKKELPLLQPHERKAYELLLSNNQWLEQEKLQQAYVQEILKKLLS